MADINLIRIDTRLIHGQICTEWSKHANVNRIIVANDELCKDEFMASVYLMAAPASVKAEIMSMQQVMDGWEKDKLGVGRILLLLKEPEHAYSLYKMGFPMDELNVGNLVASSDKKNVIKNVFLNDREFTYLKEMNDAGVKVSVQNVPHHPQVSFAEIEAKF